MTSKKINKSKKLNQKKKQLPSPQKTKEDKDDGGIRGDIIST
jgi:hypothetical protein